MKNVFSTITLLICFYGFAQENVVSTENHLKTSQSWVQRTFASVNESNDDFSVYLQDEDTVYGYLFDVNYKKIGELKAKALRNKYKTFLGNTTENATHFTYFSNSKNTKFSIQSFDFQNNIVETKEIDLDLGNEKFLQAFTSNNTFHVLSISKNQSVFNLYVFNKTDYKRHVIDLSEVTFINWLKMETSLYNILNREVLFAKLEADIPSSTINSFNSSKLYVENDKILITLDQSFAYTNIISINLENFSYTYDTVDHNQKDDPNLKFKRSNSFIVNDKLFQASIIKEHFVFSIKNRDTKETLKEFKFNRDDVLSFKDTNLIQDKLEKKKTKKFLRSATNDIVGLHVNSIGNTYEIEMGSYKESHDMDMDMMIASSIFSSIGSAGQLLFSVGQPTFGFSLYRTNSTIDSNTISVVLDGDLEFESDEISENVFDKIEVFSDKKSKFIRAENIFLYKGNMLFCATIKDSKSFLIAKFNK